MQRERPIIFSAPMVRAILDGRKTQTRRVVKPQPPAGHDFAGFTACSTCRADVGKAVWGAGDVRTVLREKHRVRCPYGQPGDRLWVREAFTPMPTETAPETPRETKWDIGYAAGGIRIDAVAPAGYNPTLYNYERWTSPIHMPRWASRITLEITSVRVERLQDISTKDCWAEGIASSPDVDPVHEYRDLWESINGPGSWEENPWVWVIEFRRFENESAAA